MNDVQKVFLMLWKLEVINLIVVIFVFFAIFVMCSHFSDTVFKVNMYLLVLISCDC